MIRTLFTLMLVSAAVFAGTSQATPGAPGTLDLTFANTSPVGAGKFASAVGTRHSFATGVAIQPDGKILLGGTCEKSGGGGYDFCALRLRSDGVIDASFGTAGKVVFPVGQSGDANALALQSDGKFLLGGRCVNGATAFCSARFHADGSLDQSFGTFGTVITFVGTRVDNVKALLIQPNGKILMVGSCDGATNIDFCAIRYNANGLPDSGFGASGFVITPVGVGVDRASSAALQPDGKIVLAGYCSPVSDFSSPELDDMCALRYDAGGSLDPTFGSGGKVIFSVNALRDRANSLALQPDGKLIFSGYCVNETSWPLCLIRTDANGNLDNSFGNAGKVVAGIGDGMDWGARLALQTDGRIVLSGQCRTGVKFDFCTLRYNSDGTPDKTFGANGEVVTAIGTESDTAYSVVLQNDGKPVVFGWCTVAGTAQFCAVRYDGGPFGYQNCKPDLDGDGLFLATTDALIYTRVALGLTGNAVVTGITFPPTASRNSWPLIRDYLVTQCGMSLVQ